MGNHYKDSLFRSLFSEKTVLLDLYNSIKGTHYDETTDLVINTLSETLFSHGKNDVSFIINRKLIVLTEHQSTINNNMPYRFLLPVAHLFENTITDKTMVYRKKLVKLPRPEFIVLYNGIESYPDKKELRLSTAFETEEGNDEINLELTVKVYNINKGHNEYIVERNETLSGYVGFVDMVRTYQELLQKENPSMIREKVLRVAIIRAIEYCKKHDILVDFWKGLSNEEVNMLASEWNLEDALAVTREEGIEEGIEIGERKIIELLRNGKTLDEIIGIIDIDTQAT
ncbi:hypothetical protein FACS1894172_07750 [Spirochaetia bacterium]|nr:hypothetical protein FACS1894164_06170 [Spirochaetia bacterium]GHU31960.1 hypothetical protein FACS1894172_07750 [Spirochaetia bacterium]